MTASRHGKDQHNPVVDTQASHQDWPAGTKKEDWRCWVCGAPTRYLHCKIICSNCGFMRDCSDP